MAIAFTPCHVAVAAGLLVFGIGHPRAEPSSVTAAGFTLTSMAVELPVSERAFPAGPGMATTQQNCTGCHSAGMVMNQPALSAAAWDGEVHKMVAVYKAPIDAADLPAIVAYLVSIKGPH